MRRFRCLCRRLHYYAVVELGEDVTLPLRCKVCGDWLIAAIDARHAGTLEEHDEGEWAEAERMIEDDLRGVT